LNISKKHILIFSSILIIGILGFKYLKPVELKLDYSPIILKEVYSDDSLTGIWKGVSYEQSDCTGCETRNQYFLSIASDSTAIVSAKKAGFKVLFREPFKGIAFGYTQKVNWISSSKYHVRGKCLVLFNSDTKNGGTFPPATNYFPNPIDALEYFNEYYKDYGCDLRPDEYPVLALKLELLPDKIILTP